ncbi:hypothetical protein I7I53_02284 [Histoplasma capsulatum var. duboisii H88]|uniref:Uncharacterized protein n=1 Tax=Ajellomyces capsulatus (strain H88) TaxID=544711 RepID=A0A8A1LPY8_AJEC8|nr:hypothetical protein I7I53_02284 [Histoplasma capsulatum var. duboisii H88]
MANGGLNALNSWPNHEYIAARLFCSTQSILEWESLVSFQFQRSETIRGPIRQKSILTEVCPAS